MRAYLIIAAFVLAGCAYYETPAPLPPVVEDPPVVEEPAPPVGDQAYDQLAVGMTVSDVSGILEREPDDMPAPPVAGEVTRRWTGVEVLGARSLVFVVFRSGAAVRKGHTPIEGGP